MSSNLVRVGLAALLCAGTACLAQQNPPQDQQNGQRQATAQCKDGSYSTNPKKSEACKGHQGVKDWYNTVGGSVDPDIKSGRTTQKGSAKQTTKSDTVVNPQSDTTMSDQRAKAINKKSGDAVVATPNDNGKTVPGPAANGSAGASNAAAGSAAGNGSASGSNSRSRNTAKESSSSSVAGRAAAPGGGPDRVWLNAGGKVYHCYGSQWYGKTKNGKYMSEQEAKDAGAKPDHGKSCASGQ